MSGIRSITGAGDITGFVAFGNTQTGKGLPGASAVGLMAVALLLIMTSLLAIRRRRSADGISG
jgi:LPXTG-motif cell wall-anchored protein